MRLHLLAPDFGVRSRTHYGAARGGWRPVWAWRGSFLRAFCSAWPVRLRGARMRTHAPTPTPHRAKLNLPSPARKAVDGGSRSSFRFPPQLADPDTLRGGRLWGMKTSSRRPARTTSVG